jgi:hypothetical protein
MSADSTTNTENVRFSRAVRFVLAAIVLGLSYPNIHCALAIKALQDAFAIHPTKAVDLFLYQHQPWFFGSSILIPVAAIVSIFTPGAVRSLCGLAVLVLIVLLQLFFTWFALTGPIVDQMVQ